MDKVSRGLCIVAMMFFSWTVSAQEPPLTPKAITNYIQSLKEMDTLSSRINTENPESAAAMAKLWLKGDTQAVAQHLEQQDYYPEIKKAINKAGFNSVIDWVETAQRVTQAFMAVELDNQEQDVAAQMEQGLEQIRSSEQLTDEQKVALTQQLKDSQTQLSRIKGVSQADKETVLPFMSELRRQFEGEE